jgi:hypothetical protein
MIMRGLPETARPVPDAGRFSFDVRKIGPEYQGAVAEQPETLVAVELIHQLIDGDGVQGHGTGLVKLGRLHKFCTKKSERV